MRCRLILYFPFKKRSSYPGVHRWVLVGPRGGYECFPWNIKKDEGVHRSTDKITVMGSLTFKETINHFFNLTILIKASVYDIILFIIYLTIFSRIIGRFFLSKQLKHFLLNRVQIFFTKIIIKICYSICIQSSIMIEWSNSFLYTFYVEHLGKNYLFHKNCIMLYFNAYN